MDVKLTELPSWILMRDFTPSGIAGTFRRGQSLMACVHLQAELWVLALLVLG
jgi:hypothetical protein